MLHCAGVGVYTEDGNEVANVISRNVFICHDIFYCRIEWQNNLGVGPAQKEGKCHHTEYSRAKNRRRVYSVNVVIEYV
jgi:hypothetical protein